MCSRPESPFRQGLHIPHPGIDDERSGSACHEVGGPKIAKNPVRGFGLDGCDHDIARLDLLVDHMHHSAVAGMQ